MLNIYPVSFASVWLYLRSLRIATAGLLCAVDSPQLETIFIEWQKYAAKLSETFHGRRYY